MTTQSCYCRGAYIWPDKQAGRQGEGGGGGKFREWDKFCCPASSFSSSYRLVAIPAFLHIYSMGAWVPVGICQSWYLHQLLLLISNYVLPIPNYVYSFPTTLYSFPTTSTTPSKSHTILELLLNYTVHLKHFISNNVHGFTSNYVCGAFRNRSELLLNSHSAVDSGWRIPVVSNEWTSINSNRKAGWPSRWRRLFAIIGPKDFIYVSLVVSSWPTLSPPPHPTAAAPPSTSDAHILLFWSPQRPAAYSWIPQFYK